VTRRCKRRKHRRRRERWHHVIAILDDATSEIHYAQLVEETSTRTVMAGLREVIERQGLFFARSTVSAKATSL